MLGFLVEVLEKGPPQVQPSTILTIIRCMAHYVNLQSSTNSSHLNCHVWNVHSVLNVLHSLVDKSNINKQLEVYNNQVNPDQVAGDLGRHSLYNMLGYFYFSLVGLLRLHALLGDFYQSIKVLENIELNKKSLYSRVPDCQITTYYYVGFAYMMMRRYADAIRTFSNLLPYVQRTKTMFAAKSYQNDQINKQTDQMIDESLHTTLREKNYSILS